MWVRDAAAQAYPLVRHAPESPTLQALLEGVVVRLAQYILTDPYANAFNLDPSVFERKFELDSGAYFFRLVAALSTALPASDVLTRSVGGVQAVREAAKLLLRVYAVEQNHEHGSEYVYTPKNADHPEDDLARGGRGGATQYTGMVWSGFRPSDDKCSFGYHVPANVLLAATLGPLGDLFAGAWNDQKGADQARKLRDEIRAGVEKFGTKETDHGTIYCYEVDGLGGCNAMDDANVPSLLSLPYLDPTNSSFSPATYEATRRFVLSERNPYFFTQQVVAASGPRNAVLHAEATRGEGSPHTEYFGQHRIWPMGLVVEGLTAEDPKERDRVLGELDAVGQGGSFLQRAQGRAAPDPPLLPESFWREGQGLQTTRPDFGWVDALYFELLESAGRCSLDAADFTAPAPRAAPPVVPPSFLPTVKGWQLTMDPVPTHVQLAVGADGAVENLRQDGGQ